MIGVLESRVGVPTGEKRERSHLSMILSVLEKFEVSEGGQRVRGGKLEKKTLETGDR